VLRTVIGTRAIKSAVSSLAGAAVLVGGIGCAYGCPEPMCGPPPPDAGRDITIGDVDTGVKDSGAADMGVMDATMETSTDASGDAADAKSD
jgi:hypothetical protein